MLFFENIETAKYTVEQNINITLHRAFGGELVKVKLVM